MSETIAGRLRSMGIDLPRAAAPVASYAGWVRHGDLVFVSGQLPFEDGRLSCTGTLGAGVTIEDGQAAARICAINILAQLGDACDGDLERIDRCIRLGGFVASSAEFFDQPRVVNGASEFVAQVLGDRGRHARAAVGVAALPLNACVEVEALFSLKSG